MSMADAEKAEQKSESMDVDEKDEDYSEVMNDPAFLQSVLQNLPGVDPQSEAVRKAVGEGAKEDKDKEKKDDEKKWNSRAEDSRNPSDFQKKKHFLYVH